jgi:signal transduction histidine kinase
MAYRLVQEATTNAFRHAGATRIEASLKFETPVKTPSLRDPALAGLVIRVADDGRGLQGEAEAGMGLASMRDRVRLMGGSVSMDSPRDGGVVVEARFATLQPANTRDILPTHAGHLPEKSSNH